MINFNTSIKIVIISLAVLLIIATLLCSVIFRYGFSKYNIKKYKISKQINYKSWHEIFNKSKKIEIIALKTGNAIASPGARPYLDLKSLPANYNINTKEISPISSYIIHHPEKGSILIDTGLNQSFSKNPPYGDLPLMLSLYQRVTRTSYTQEDGKNLGNLLHKYSVLPSMVFLTHIHPDHISGLNEINDSVPILFGEKENTYYYRAIGGKYLSGKKNIFTLNFEEGQKIGPFTKAIDILGDASIWAISSPGHTPDHISYFINAKNAPTLIVGDLTISEFFFHQGIKSGSDYGEKGGEDLERSLHEFAEFKKNYPMVKVLFTHADIAY